MRLKFPTHVSVPYAVAFAAILAVVQLIEGTDLSFSILCFAFIVLSTLTFNLAGGMNRPSGSYVLFFALLTVIGAVVLKAILGEPAQTNLEAPLLTMSIYTISMAVMMGVVSLKNRLAPSPRGLGLALGSGEMNLHFSAAGCIIVGLTLNVLNTVVQAGNGSVLSALNQINFFLPLGLILSTVAVVKDSDGRRSLGFLSLLSGGTIFVLGMAGFSKQALFTPLAAWAIGAIYGGLRLRWIHAVSVGAMVLLLAEFVTPIAQVGRNMVEGTTMQQRLEIFLALAAAGPQTRQIYEDTLAFADTLETRHGYYNHTLGLGDRLAMFQVDDGLISWVDRNGPIGYAPLSFYLGNLVPHALNPNKDAPGVTQYNGNYYAHLIGGYLAADDFSTGISFSPLSEAWALGRWEGILLLMPVLWFLLFLSSDLLCGELSESPWGLLPMLLFLHLAPESLVAGLIGYLGVGNFGVILGIWFCVTVAPILGSLVGTGVLRSQRRRSREAAAEGFDPLAIRRGI